MRKAIVFFLIILVNLDASAQSINLEQARILALANSRSLARYELAIRSSILDERNQLFSLLPSVSAGYSASMEYLKDWQFVNPIDTFSAGASFSITQIIFQGGKGFIQKAISAIGTESVRKDALAEYFNVLDTIDNAYYAALEAAASLEAEETSLRTAVLSLSIAEVRQASGMITQGDYLKAMADKETRENAVNQSRRSLALNMRKLGSLTGLSEPFQLEKIDFSAYENALERLAVISDDDASLLFDEFWNILLVSNPSLAKSALNNQRAERNLSLAKRDFSPTLSATIFATGLNYSAANGFNSTSSGGLLLRGSIPVDFWILNSRIERSSIARDSAILDYTNTHNSLEQDLQNALLNAFAQAGAVLSSRRSLEYTERHFEFVMERYRLLQSSVSDLNEATSLFISSRNNQIKASYGFMQSISRLRSLCAMEDEDKLLKILSSGQ